MPKYPIDYSSIVQEAFLKLSASVYFDKQNLHLRHKLALFIATHEQWQQYLHTFSISITSEKDFMKRYNDDIKLLFLPKSTKKNNEKFSEAQVSGNFYTNQVYLEPAVIDKIAIFIDVPIELHIIAVLWLMVYGASLDKELSKHCIGNRLHLDKNGEIIHSRTLFHRYERQYQKWWSKGIQAAKELFDKKEDVTIVNFDFKEYYHSISFDQEELTKHLRKKHKDIDKDPLHSIFLAIHKKYAGLLIKLRHPALKKGMAQKKHFPLPIGLLSSYVLGNWYLKRFDKLIMDQINPVYYGRYVDDLMIVIKDTVIKDYQKDINSLKRSKSADPGQEKYVIANHYIKQHFKGVFTREKQKANPATPAYKVDSKYYDNIKVQLEKFFIYQFNAELSPNLLNRFVEEQRERSSAFQFLSDDEDDVYKDIDQITFESNFEYSDLSKSRFKNLDDNKYKLSVYLAKLIRGSVTGGPDYQPREITKLKKYFKGYYLIKNFYFWEKLFTLFTVRREYRYVFELYYKILNEIGHAQVGESVNTDGKVIKDQLKEHLDYALKMAIGLYPDMIRERTLTKAHRELIQRMNNNSIFRDSGLLRKSGMYHPLLQFATAIKRNRKALFDKEILQQYLLAEKESDDINTSILFPYRIKFYEACLFTMYSSLRQYLTPVNPELKRHPVDFNRLKTYLEEAFKLFSAMNYLSLFPAAGLVKDNYFRIVDDLNTEGGDKLQQSPSKIETTGLMIPNSRRYAEKLRICMVNKYVDFRDDEKSLEKNPDAGSRRFEEFNVILDDVKRVDECDIFVMPELALPYQFIYYYVTQASFSQIAFVTGIEHWTVGNLSFNFLLTCLPIEVHGDKDAVPVFRLKNHYAPVEEEWIQGKHLVVPKPKPYRYELVNWRGIYFSTYNCFELADINHRHLFYGMLDVIFAPVWNQDIHYYNSLVETASRDMHCFISLSNTTQYGDTRVIEPAGHITRDKLRVKGGAVKGHRSAILIADLKVKLLRYFQTHEYRAAESFNKNHNTQFKPLPPDFPYELAQLRHGNNLFKTPDISDKPG